MFALPANPAETIIECGLIQQIWRLPRRTRRQWLPQLQLVWGSMFQTKVWEQTRRCTIAFVGASLEHEPVIAGVALSDGILAGLTRLP